MIFRLIFLVLMETVTLFFHFVLYVSMFFGIFVAWKPTCELVKVSFRHEGSNCTAPFPCDRQTYCCYLQAHVTIVGVGDQGVYRLNELESPVGYLTAGRQPDLDLGIFSSRLHLVFAFTGVHLFVFEMPTAMCLSWLHHCLHSFDITAPHVRLHSS